MAYRIEILPSAERELAELPKKARAQVARRIGSLADNPRPRGSKQLRAADGLHRIRSGDYRILYRIEDNRLVVLVVKVGSRRDVYRRLP